MIGTTEIIVIAIVILLLFGGKKIPELMRGLGKGMRSFKQGMNGEEEEPDNATADDSPTQKEKEEIAQPDGKE